MKLENLKLLVLLVVFLIAVQVPVVAQRSNVYGGYLFCDYPCMAIQISRDLTFERLLYGDLFNDERVRGTWKFVGKNKIKAISFPPEPYLSIAEITGKRNNFLISITDMNGA